MTVTNVKNKECTLFKELFKERKKQRMYSVLYNTFPIISLYPSFDWFVATNLELYNLELYPIASHSSEKKARQLSSTINLPYTITYPTSFWSSTVPYELYREHRTERNHIRTN